MIYLIFYRFREWVSPLRELQYITFRTMAASLTALLLSLLLGPWMIRQLRKFHAGQIIRTDGPASHKQKAGTPTMGGLLILTSVIVPTLLWARLNNPDVWIAMFATTAFGAIGFLDDYLKVTRHSHHGLFARYKFATQIIVGLAIGVALLILSRHTPALYSTRLTFPVFKRWIPDLGLWYVPFTVLVLVGATNAVNLTDGLDGLAISTFTVSAATFTALTYVTGHQIFSNYLGLIRLPLAGELTVFCGTLVGASLGFLWWNAHPAEVFMGDVGSLGLGGALGTVAILIKQELLLPIVGGVFVIEALSVIIQVASFKTRGKRVFKMAPLHHHFELLGWKEPKIIMRFLILAIIFALLSLVFLKLR